MASDVYANAKLLMATDKLGWVNPVVPFRAMLVGAGYTYNHTHQTVADVVAQEVLSPSYSRIDVLDPQADPPKLFDPDETKYECEDGDTETPQHQASGLDPQTDPDRLFQPDESTSTKSEGHTESPQHTESGLEPTQAPLEHRMDESAFHKDDGALEGPQHAASGLEPQSDPAEQFEPKESGFENDCDDGD